MKKQIQKQSWVKAACLAAVICMTNVVLGQVTLTGTSYTQNFDGMGATGTTTPAGWSVSSDATATALGTLGTTVATNGVATTTGAFNNYPNGSGRCLGLRQTASFANPGAAFVLAISGTVGKSNFQLSLDHVMASAQPRVTEWTVQYSVNGTAWTSLGTYSDPTNAGGVTPGSYSIGSSFNNVPGTVYIRVVALASATGTGNRDSYAIDNVVLSWTNAASCAVPAGLAKSSITDSGMTLTWNGVAGTPDGYEYAVNTSSTAPASGTAVTDTFLNVTGLSGSTKYYVHLRTDCGSNAVSAWAKDSFTTLASCVVPSIGTQPAHVTACSGSATRLVAAASGSSLTYLWQGDAGSGYTSLVAGSSYSGVTNDTLDILAATAGISYRCIVSNACGADTSDVATPVINPIHSLNNPQSICNGGSYTINGHAYTVQNTYYDTLQTVSGCDSIIVTQLTVNPTHSINNPQSICNGGSYTINGHAYTVQNTYYDTLQTVSGCDSIIVTQLTVNPTHSINNPQSICNGGLYTINGHAYTVQNTYYDTLQTVSGCDSIIVTQLTVNPTHSINNPQSICNGGSYTINGHAYTVQNTYYDTLQTVSGCDSIIVTQLTVNPTHSINNPQSICNGGSYTINGHTYTVQNMYYDTLQTVSGCDSIIVTQLTVNAKPSTSSITGNTTPEINTTETYSVINTMGSTYEWIITNGTQVSGTTTNSITVQWGSAAGAGSVRVIETNTTGCKGDTVQHTTSIALPVKLIRFAAAQQNGVVELTWSTASETNNDYFVIERSTTGFGFTAVGRPVKGAGNSTAVKHYQLTDHDVARLGSNQLIYRIKQVDYDGAVHYSPAISVNPGQHVSGLSVSVFPNPAYSSEAQIRYQLAEAGPVQIAIYNMHGTLVQQTENREVAGVYQHALPVLPSGIYIVNVSNGKELRMIKVVIR